MSTIHRSCELDGRSCVLMAGSARLSTVKSIAYTTHGKAMTARPIHSRRVALATQWWLMVRWTGWTSPTTNGGTRNRRDIFARVLPHRMGRVVENAVKYGYRADLHLTTNDRPERSSTPIQPSWQRRHGLHRPQGHAGAIE